VLEMICAPVRVLVLVLRASAVGGARLAIAIGCPTRSSRLGRLASVNDRAAAPVSIKVVIGGLVGSRSSRTKHLCSYGCRSAVLEQSILMFGGLACGLGVSQRATIARAHDADLLSLELLDAEQARALAFLLAHDLAAL